MSERFTIRRRTLAVALGALCASAHAQTITVNVGDDYVDFPAPQTVAELPGPDGRLSVAEAVIAANTTPGPQTIEFAIPVSEWMTLFTDVAVIRLENMLYVSGDETTFDFTTQVALTGNTNPDGNEVGFYYAGVPAGIPCLWIAADDCIVRGLDVALGNNFGNGIWVTGNHNHVVGCTTTGLKINGSYGDGDFNTIGGVLPGDGNSFSEGCDIISDADSNVVVGNIFRWGLRLSGDTFYGTCDDNRIGGPSAAERKNFAGKGYYGEEGFPTGTQLEIYHTNNTIVENNFVGTTPDGSMKLPGRSGTGGIYVAHGSVNTLVRDNLVSGIVMVGTNHYQGQRFGVGIGVAESANGTRLEGNRIGVAADGVTPIPNVLGVIAESNPNGVPGATFVGGPGEGQGNLIANNETTGLRIFGSAVSGVRISGNSIRDNGALGIDLVGANGVNANDPGDADTGPNGLQNYPVLTTARAYPDSTTITGALNSLPGQQFSIEFFTSPQPDPTGFGEGAQFLGAVSVTTNANGDAPFEAALPGSVQPGWVVSATAIRASNGDTSEFSGAIVVESAGVCPGDTNGDGVVNFADLNTVLSQFGQTGAGLSGDVNSDGSVNFADLNMVLSNFGAVC